MDLRSLKFLVCIFISSTILGCPGNVSTLGVDVHLDTEQLSNGLKIIFLEDPSVPVVSYQTWVKVGSYHEADSKSGLAHLFEHLMFKGTEAYGPREFFVRLESKGAEVNAFTTRDYTVFYVNTVESLLDEVINLESDRLANFKVTRDLLESEKKIVFEERKLRLENSPQGKLQEALWRLAFNTHPYGRPVIGEINDIEGLTVDDSNLFFTSFYQPRNVVIVVSGAFDKKALFEKIKNKYGEIKNGNSSSLNVDIPSELPQASQRIQKIYENVVTPEFAIAYPICDAANKDSYALDVLATSLFQGRSSRANRQWVERDHHLQEVSGVAYTPSRPGLFVIQGTANQGRAVDGIPQMLDELVAEVIQTGISQEELSRAVKNLTIQTVDSIKTPFGLGQLVGTVMMVFEDPLRFESDLTKYISVRSEDVVRVAKKYLIPVHRSIVYLLPKDNQDKQ